MNRRTVCSRTALFLMLLLSMPGLIALVSSPIPRPRHLVSATIWGPETVDPAWLYDTASATVVMNVYDTLINFYVNRSLPSVYDWGRVDEFEPCIAVEWLTAQPPHKDAPIYTNSTYYFKIRCPANGYDGVPWHDGDYGTVTTADVEYSFERWMGFDRTYGPAWMIFEPLLEGYWADWSDPTFGTKIDKAVESNSTHVWFNLKAPNYPPMIFMQVVAQSWASIIPQAWAADNGCWPGEDHSNANMSAYYDPVISPLDEAGYIECGSGPYTLTNLDAVGHTYRLDWFSDYWGDWPADGCDDYLETITVRGIDEWETRKAMFLAGDADFCYVPNLHLPEIVTNWEDEPLWEEETYPPGITCFPGLGSMIEMNMIANLNISLPNDNIGEPPYTEIHETGIPYWFFNDTYTPTIENPTVYANGGKYVRKAIAYCFNWTEYMTDVVMGEGIQPSSCQIKGNAYWQYIWDVNGTSDTLAYIGGTPNPAADGSDLDPPDTVKGPPPYSQPALSNGSTLPPVPCYYRNLTRAEEMFKLAWDGEVWDKGFTFDMLYNTGNDMRMVAAFMMKEAVESIHPENKFHVNVREVDWPTFLAESRAGRLSFWYIGWLADYPDPHNWFQPYMHSDGTFAARQSYSNPYVDQLVEQGVKETDDDKRILIYWELANIFHEEAFNLPLYQSTGRHWERDWCRGWYFNPIYPGSFYYHYWKAQPELWEPVDLSALGSIDPSTPEYPEVQVYEKKMMLGGELVVAEYDLTVHRIDEYSTPVIVYCVAYFNRTNEWGNYTVLKYTSDIFGLTIGGDYVHSFNWTEDATIPAEEITPGNWEVNGVVSVVSGNAYDEDLANNRISGGTVEAVEISTDINGDGKVDMKDIGTAAKAFGSFPGHDRWNADCDINGDDKVDMKDIGTIAKDFGLVFP